MVINLAGTPEVNNREIRRELLQGVQVSMHCAYFPIFMDAAQTCYLTNVSFVNHFITHTVIYIHHDYADLRAFKLVIFSSKISNFGMHVEAVQAVVFWFHRAIVKRERTKFYRVLHFAHKTHSGSQTVCCRTLGFQEKLSKGSVGPT